MELAEARAHAGFTMQDMADELGITRQTYSKMEKDADLVTVSDARKIAKKLNCDVNEIFFATDCK